MTRFVPVPKGSTWFTIGAVSCLGFLALLGIAVSPTAEALGALPNPDFDPAITDPSDPHSVAPAGAASSVVSSAMIPLTGTVGNIRLRGVVHVVTQVLIQEPTPFSTGFLTVHVYLTPSDVSAVDRQGNAYLAHGAGRATVRLAAIGVTFTESALDDMFVMAREFTRYPFPVGGARVERLTDTDIPGSNDVEQGLHFALQLHLSFTSDGVLDAIHSEAEAIDLQPHSSLLR